MTVEFQDVSLRRGGETILEGIRFSTNGRGLFVVFGPSGAGKTSLLRLVNRLEECHAGRILLDGRDIRELPPQRLRRRVGMIFQEPRLLPGTVEHNVRFPAAHHGIPVDVEALLGAVGLKGFAGRPVTTLSAGQKQRVAIARALAVNPRVLLLDEPTSSLDRESARRIETLLHDRVEAGRLEVLFVTHSRSQALRLGGRGIVLDRGRIVFDGEISSFWGKESRV